MIWGGIGAAVLIVLYVSTRKAPACTASTSTAPSPGLPGTDATSLISALQASITQQNQALADLENQNAATLAAGFTSGFGSVAAGLQGINANLIQGFSSLQPPTVTLASLLPPPSATQLQSIAAAGGGNAANDPSGHAQKVFLTAPGQYYLCQLKSAFPAAFQNVPASACQGVAITPAASTPTASI